MRSLRNNAAQFIRLVGEEVACPNARCLESSVGNDIPPVKGFALRDEGEEGFVRMIGLEFMQFELEFYKYILVNWFVDRVVVGEEII